MLRWSRAQYLFVKYAFADGGYAGCLVNWLKQKTCIALQIVRRNVSTKSFEVLPRRWVIERTFTWIIKNRRFVRNYKQFTTIAKTLIIIAATPPSSVAGYDLKPNSQTRFKCPSTNVLIQLSRLWFHKQRADLRGFWMWTTENRGRYDRSILRYPSDLTDDEWSLVGPLSPRARWGGNKRIVDIREVINGLMYILSTGC